MLISKPDNSTLPAGSDECSGGVLGGSAACVRHRERWQTMDRWVVVPVKVFIYLFFFNSGTILLYMTVGTSSSVLLQMLNNSLKNQ